MNKLAWSMVALAGVVGCGAEIVTGSAGAGGAGVDRTGAGASGPGPTSTGTGGPTNPCPAVQPNDSTPCDQPGAECSYGLLCTSAGALAECKNGLWFWNPMVACEG